MRRNEVDAYAEQVAKASIEVRPSFGLSRRKLAVAVAGFVCLWLIGIFARQVGEAAAAADQADAMKARNVAVEREIKSLQTELSLIQEPGFVDTAARGYLLGSPDEIPFTIDPKAPPLPADAPGSAGIKPDEKSGPESPLDAWLAALFGSQP
jgi:cell division protein FtsB